MPKLDKEKMDLKIRQVEDAALKLFREKGFHGVGIREIARGAGGRPAEAPAASSEEPVGRLRPTPRCRCSASASPSAPAG